MHQASVREKALDLRGRGYSYSYISLATGLSKSTLSEWLGKVPYSPNTEVIERIGKALAISGEKKAALKRNSIEKAAKEAKKEIGAMTKRDLFIFGLGLYLGEGSKTNGITRVTNADPAVILLALAWFTSLGIMRPQFFVTLHLYPDSDVQKCLQFWSKTTSIPLSQFGKVQIDRRTNKRINRAGKLPYGTAHLGVRSLGKKEFGVFLSRKIQAWTDEVFRKVTRV